MIIKIEKLSLTEKFIEQIRLKIPDFEIQVRKDGIYASRQTNNIDNVIYFEKGKATNGELNLSIWVNVNYPYLQKIASSINSNLKNKSTLPYRLRHLYKVLNLNSQLFESDQVIKREVLPIKESNIEKYITRFIGEYESIISKHFQKFKDINGLIEWYNYLIDIESNREFRSLWRDPYNHLIALKLSNRNIEKTQSEWENQIEENEKILYKEVTREIRSLTLDMMP